MLLNADTKRRLSSARENTKPGNTCLATAVWYSYTNAIANVIELEMKVRIAGNLMN